MPAAPVRSSLRLLDAADELEAQLTCPTHRTARHALVGQAVRAPSVDLGTWTTHVRYARRRRPADRTALAATYAYHARRLSRRYYRHGEAADDLEQVALEALLLAIERFDPARSLPFLGYANPTIVGALKRHYRDVGWAVRVPRRAHDLSSALRDAEDMLVQDLGRQPTDGEVADLLGIGEDDVRSTRTAQHARASMSLDAAHADHGEPGGSDPVGFDLGEVDAGIDMVADRVAVERIMRILTPEARELLALYYGEELSQSQIGQRLGISQMQVSRLLARALQQVRSHLPAG